MIVGQQKGRMAYIEGINFAWARVKNKQPNYVLLIPAENNEFLELQFIHTNALFKKAKSLFESHPYEYMEIRRVNSDGFLSFHTERIYKNDKLD